jgi:hypothetical protein
LVDATKLPPLRFHDSTSVINTACGAGRNVRMVDLGDTDPVEWWLSNHMDSRQEADFGLIATRGRDIVEVGKLGAQSVLVLEPHLPRADQRISDAAETPGVPPPVLK